MATEAPRETLIVGSSANVRLLNLLAVPGRTPKSNGDARPRRGPRGEGPTSRTPRQSAITSFGLSSLPPPGSPNAVADVIIGETGRHEPIPLGRASRLVGGCLSRLEPSGLPRPEGVLGVAAMSLHSPN